MQILKCFLFFFLLIPIGASPQQVEPFSSFSDFHATGNYVELQSFQWQSDYMYRDMYQFYDHSLFIPSEDLLSNIFSSAYQKETGIGDVNPPQLGDPNSGVPVGNGLYLLVLISIIYILGKWLKAKGRRNILYPFALSLFTFFPAHAADIPLTYNANVPAGTTLTIRLSNIDAIPTDCKNATPLVIVDPTKGNYLAGPGVIEYQSTLDADSKDSDSFVFTVNCNADTYTVTTNIDIVPKPDNILNSDCFIDPSFKWTIQKAGHTSQFVYSMAQPFVGDLNGDKNLKIITLNNYASLQSNTLLVFNSDLTLDFEIATPTMYAYVVNPLCIADVENDGKGEVIIATDSSKVNSNYNIYGTGPVDCRQKLICYSNTGAVKWVSSDSYVTSTTLPNTAPSLVIADIDGDGHSEILAGDRIFAAESGKLLATLPAGGRGLRSNMASTLANPNTTYMSVFADINNDGKLEVVAGNTTYSVTINSRTDTSSNSAVILTQSGRGDGWTSVADIDGDGYLDIVVMSGDNGNSGIATLYAWSGRTNNTLIGQYPIWSGTGSVSGQGSRAMLGDITGNGHPDIVITYHTGMQAFTYNAGSKTFTALWSGKTTNDTSGATTMSMFDFNQDGEVELVYRDEKNLRILDKTGKDLISFPCYSGTHTEYPIVADVDNDNDADILVSGSIEGPTYNSTMIRIQKFSSVNNKEWAPARPVWNQHGYNAVHINDDLTVPKHQLHPATVLAGEDEVFGTVDDVRLYNAFLQQQTTINQYGVPFIPAPDMSFTSGYSLDVIGTNVEISFSMTNTGEATMEFPVPYVIYKNSPALANVIANGSYNINILVGQTVNLTLTIPLSELETASNLIISINDNGSQFVQQECVTNNNRLMISLSDDYYGLPYNSTLFPTVLDILENDDSKTNATELFIDAIVSSAGSTLSIQKNLTSGRDGLIYTSTPGFFGTDTLTYSASGHSGSIPNIEILEAKVFIYVFDERTLICPPEGDVTGEVINIKIEDTLNDVEVNFFYPGTSTSANEQPIPNTFPATVPLRAEVTFEASVSPVAAFNNVNMPVNYEIDVVPTLLYWNWTNTKVSDNNWNNPANWLLADGTPANAVPAWCTTVHIPGNLGDGNPNSGSAYYPFLDSLHTIRNYRYGEPICDSIIFHFGGEVAQLNYLTYNKAFVQYNIGYYESDNYDADPENGDLINGHPVSATPMTRSQWYGLSIPLKNVATGDFSFGGKPHTWQMSFICQPAESDVNTWTGDFTIPFNTNSIELNKDYAYSYAFWANRHEAGYIGSDGNSSYAYQSGLQGVKGVIEIPFYENSTISAFHRNHEYNAMSRISSFWYYNWEQVDLSRNYSFAPGTIQRSDSAYRFIFDEKIVQTATNQIAFSIRVPAGSEIMIGNPFLSSLDFGEFYAANNTKIENRYRLFEEEAFVVHQNDTIGVLQGFFIKTLGTAGDSLDLYFPFETVSVTRAIHQPHDSYFRSSTYNEQIVVTATHEGKSNRATLYLNSDEEKQNIYKLFYEEAKVTPQVYFTDENNQKNEIQYRGQTAEGERQTVLPLGIRSPFGNRITLDFEIDANIESLVLFDKRTGTRQDLLQNSSYSFLQSDHSDYTDRFELEIQSPTAINIVENDNPITIYQSNQTLTVSSKENLQSVELSDMQGRRIQSSNNIDNTFYQMELTIPSGVYIVKVQLENGTTKTQKMIVK